MFKNLQRNTLKLLSLILLSWLITACEKPDEQPNAQVLATQAAAIVEAPAPPKRVNVATLTLAPQSLQHKIEFVGKLLPNERVDVHNELAGVVEQVKFEEGDKVSKDRVLAHISTKELTVRRDMAQADFQLAEINYQRNLQLDRKQLIARSILDQSRTQRQLAKYNWDLAEVQLQKSLVKAPISGVVKVRRVEPGEYLKVGMKLSEILDLRKMRVELDVPELDIAKLQKGQTVKIELYAESGKLYDGKIHRIGVEADAQTRSFPVEVQMVNPKQRLRSGMLAKVSIDLGISENQVVIPRNAIIEGELERVVFVASDGKAKRRIIETGISEDNLVQVISGLQHGESLIVEGQTRLINNEPINITRSDS
ncbi:MAG: efflux RND transporter periplasmic adaptor subunit [SAR324 cluster bacterium]|nr:efflux RND transporter periplasmic adaptor subunit [SAR324 cluster bacterium]